MQGTLYIVDAYNFLFRAFHAMPPLSNSRGQQTGAIYGLCQMLLRIEREHVPSHLCAVFDAPGKTFRDDLYPAYKANRAAMPPELAAQIGLVPTVLDAFGIQSLTMAGIEADDVIATVTKQAAARGLQVVICSSDKDLMQLVGGPVSLLDTMKNKMVGPSDVEEKWGVPPALVGDLLALVGDSVDNVPGVPGIGPKTAAELLKTFGNLDALMARADEVKGKRGQALVQSRELVKLSRLLVTLKDDVELPRPVETLARVAPDKDRLYQLFRDFEFVRLMAANAPSETAAPSPGASDSQAESAAVQVTDTAPTAAPKVPAPEMAPVEVITAASALAALADRLKASLKFAVTGFTTQSEPLRAELIGLAFGWLSEQTLHRAYVPVAQQTSLLDTGSRLSVKAAFDVLRPVFGDPAVAKVVHDGKTLEVLFGVYGVPFVGVVSDSMLGAYLLDASRPRYDLHVVAHAEGAPDTKPREEWLGTGRSAATPGDVEASVVAGCLAAEVSAIWVLDGVQRERLQEAKLSSLYEQVELPLSHVLARIEQQGVRLDTGFLRELSQQTAVAVADLEREIHEVAGGPFNIGSPKQLAKILFEKLQLPVLRKTKTGPSTDADVLEELAAMHPVPAKILEYRTLTKLKGTYLDALPQLVNPRTGRLHTTFNQAVAATGRLSSSDPNLQNIPIRTELGRKIRNAFIADPGYVIVSADYSQIELRILAHYSQDPAFLDAFRKGQDIHTRTAAEVFGVDLDQVTPEHRRIAKAINFGLVFGQSDFGLSQVLRIARAEAKAYIEKYFARYAGVKTYMDRAIAEARATAESTTLLGRRRPIPELAAGKAQQRAHGERVARNTPIQGSAADILKLAMIRVDGGLAQHPGARLLLTVHDELVFEVPAEGVSAFAAWAKNEMENAFTLDVPLVVDVGHGPTWGDAH
ncbi:MAG: DNA polymerase I [Deltaproteobacteria bacterium]|nr:DNA polymerase I [Deltaproteobacteria bacterium]